MTDFRDELAVFGGACLGGLARYSAGLVLPSLSGLSVATLTVNWLGTFFLVFCVKGYLAQKGVSGRMILALGTGFCGSLTTFSSAMLDLVKLAQAGSWSIFSYYAALLILGGLLVAFGSWWLLERVGLWKS